MFRIVRNNFFAASSWRRAFVVSLVFVTFASGLFWLDFFRGYGAEVTVLIVSRTGTAPASSDVAEDVAELVRTLAFYDRMLAGSDRIDDAFEGYAPDKRKALWNGTVSVEHPDDSGVLVIRARNDASETAKLLARETAQTMFSVAGFYYDVKTDIDMRIIDGPIVSAVLVRPISFVMTSVLSGFFVTSLFFFLLSVVPRLIAGRKRDISFADTHMAPEKAYPEFSIGEAVPWIDPKKFIPAKPSTLSFQETKEASSVQASRSVAHAPAPANLPVADDEVPSLSYDDEAFPFEFEAPAEASSEESEEMFPENQEETRSFTVPKASESGASDVHPEEPTAEEYKRRLNELLSGSR